MAEFQLIGFVRLLAEHQVEYLIVGGVGSVIQGATIATTDLDIMPDPEPKNLERLARALSSSTTRKKESNSTSYESHEAVDALEFKTETITSFQMSFGVLDVLMELPAIGYYADVLKNAKRYDLEGTTLVVADIDDIIKSKQETDRSKDWRAMDALYEARDEQRQNPDDFEIRPDDLDI